MARSSAERTEINNFLGRRGLSTLDDPRGMVQQIGFLIRDHDHFRSLLIRSEPEHRREMYESLRPHLRFAPKPLDVYVSEAGRMAEREQLPTVGPDGQFQPFHPLEIRSEPEAEPEEVPEVERRAIAGQVQKLADTDAAQAAVNETFAKKRLWLVCAKCTAEEVFTGDFKSDCITAARLKGWRYSLTADGGCEICPNCRRPD